MPQFPEDDISSLERAKERLYRPDASSSARTPLATPDSRSLPHAWEDKPLQQIIAARQGERRVHFAGVFFIATFVFFLAAVAVAGYFFYFGGNAVSVDKIIIDIQGPTTIAGGDIVPLSLTITNKNPVAIENATIEIDFPSGTRDATNVLTPYPRYIENLGTLPSGARVTRSIKAVLFGGTGQSLSLPVSLSYATAGSNAIFVKKSSYELGISTAPLEVAVSTLSETVSGKPLTLTLTVRSNSPVPLNNVVLAGAFPFGFSVTSSSLPLSDSSFLLGTLAPGASKTITLTGTLIGQNKEQRVFRFTAGTANTANNQTLAVTYMTQDATVTIAAPFIDATLSLNGNPLDNAVMSPGTSQNVSLSYTNTLATRIENVMVSIALSGSGIDYSSIKTSSGFYRSSDHTIVFSKDTDSSLAALAPSASGVGAFSFSTLAPGALVSSPTVTFTISVSGMRAGQTNVPEQVGASIVKTAKVATAVVLSAYSLHSSGPLHNSGPIPPRADQATTYAIVWNVQNKGSVVAGGTVSAVLPGYVSYTDITAGVGSFSFDSGSHMVSWSTGDLPQGGSAQGIFQVSLTPSTSQKGSSPKLVGDASFTGHDRFAGVQVSASADPVTIETKNDPGYVSASGTVQ